MYKIAFTGSWCILVYLYFVDLSDISNREDITLLVNAFYKKVIPDPEIGPFFSSVRAHFWEHHIPVMIGFWENILLGSPTYSGNPMDKHFALHKVTPLEPRHFKRWLDLWTETVHENFQGTVADEAVRRATTIAGIMEYKIGSRS